MVVIGAGRIGLAVERAADDNGEPCTLLSRDSDWSVLEREAGEPILVATRNDDLDAVLQRVPKQRHQDLVFIQNGALGPWLEDRSLGACTRGLLFFAVADRQSDAVPGPEPSPFTGPLALQTVRWFVRLGLPAQVVDWPRFCAWELEKLCWNAAFGLLCEVYDCTVGEVCDQHEDDLRALVSDLRRVGRASTNVDLPQDWLVERLMAYSRSIPDYRGAVKEWPWRNGWFVREAVRLGVSTPEHARLLIAAGHEERLPGFLKPVPELE